MGGSKLTNDRDRIIIRCTVRHAAASRTEVTTPGKQETTIMKCKAGTMRAGGAVLLVLMTLTEFGCISSRSDVTYGAKGPVVPNSTLRQVKCGRTTRNWLLGVLGEPSRAVRTSANTEVLTYEYTKTVDSDFSFFIFFDADNRREERTAYVFELEDGVVTRYWKER
jgi:hypothetical protein